MHRKQETWVSPSSSSGAFPVCKPGNVPNLETLARYCSCTGEGRRARTLVPAPARVRRRPAYLTSRGCEPVREGPRAAWEGGVRRENETERTGRARTSMGSSSDSERRADFRAST